MNVRFSLAWFCLAFFLGFRGEAEGSAVSLAGAWSFRLDQYHQGVTNRWFAASDFPHTIHLPGCLQEQGFGNLSWPHLDRWADGNSFAKLALEFPFWEELGNDRITGFPPPEAQYIGAAWYARTVEIPEDWAGSRIFLFLERCYGETWLWVNGQEAGRRDGLGVPHEYDLTRLLNPGRHRIALRVENGRMIEAGGLARNVSGQTARTWNGIVGRLELRATPTVWIEDVQVFPDLVRKSARIIAIIHNSFIGSGDGRLSVQARSFNSAHHHGVPEHRYDIEIRGQECRIAVEYPMGDEVQLWDEFTPALYRLKVSLYGVIGDRSVNDMKEATFGMREYKVEGGHFTINRRPVFLRDNADGPVFSQSCNALTSVEEWRRFWAIYRMRGVNLARFRSWCPPEAAFTAADETGLYLAPEVGEGRQAHSPEGEDFCRRESQAMLRWFGNHPSFVMMGLGHEMGGDPALSQRLLAEWRHDPRRIYFIKTNSVANPPGAK